MSKIHTFLWFDTQAEEAMSHYCSIFKNSKPGAVSRYPESMGGAVMTAEFDIEDFHITALNAGPRFKFNEAISLYVDCADQAEVDYYWDALIAGGGEESMCGWLKDKFGLSWQIVPRQLPQLMNDKDRGKADRVVQAMLKMRKIVVADLETAAAG